MAGRRWRRRRRRRWRRRWRRRRRRWRRRRRRRRWRRRRRRRWRRRRRRRWRRRRRRRWRRRRRRRWRRRRRRRRRWRRATGRVLDRVDVRDVTVVERRGRDICRRAVRREGRPRVHDLVRVALERQRGLPRKRAVSRVPAASEPGDAEVRPVASDYGRSVGADHRVVDDRPVEERPPQLPVGRDRVEVTQAAREIDGAVRADRRSRHSVRGPGRVVPEDVPRARIDPQKAPAVRTAHGGHVQAPVGPGDGLALPLHEDVVGAADVPRPDLLPAERQRIHRAQGHALLIEAHVEAPAPEGDVRAELPGLLEAGITRVRPDDLPRGESANAPVPPKSVTT